MWHASYDTVRRLMKQGSWKDGSKIETRSQLVLGVIDGTGYGHCSPFYTLAQSGAL